MYEKLSQIDELTRPDHYYLLDSDQCYYFGEYTARKGFSHSATNSLILNLKKNVVHAGQPGYQYKNVAIQNVSNCLNSLLSHPELISFVPVPPSKHRNDPLYDNRLNQVLDQFRVLNNNVDYRDLVIQTTSTEATHNADNRLSPEELLDLYTIDQSLIAGIRQHIFIFDDMLTTGSHFKAIEQLLNNYIDNIIIYGLFVARRAPEAIDWDFNAVPD